MRHGKFVSLGFRAHSEKTPFLPSPKGRLERRIWRSKHRENHSAKHQEKIRCKSEPPGRVQGRTPEPSLLASPLFSGTCDHMGGGADPRDPREG